MGRVKNPLGLKKVLGLPGGGIYLLRAPRACLFMWRFSAAGMLVYPHAEAAGGRKAPRHEVAGG